MNLARAAAYVGYFGLLILWLAWATAFAPPRHAPTSLVLAVATLPLLMPLRGMLYDRRNSFIGLGLLGLVYFIHGVVATTDPGQRVQAGLEIVFSLCLFGGSLARLRLRGD
ncbi:MAG: DUF2069 domain-containing protein [Candidatus Methylumidiphilus sp.]